MLVLVVMVEVGGGGAGGVGSVTGCGSRVICGLFALLLPFVLPCLLACLRACFCLIYRLLSCTTALLLDTLFVRPFAHSFLFLSTKVDRAETAEERPDRYPDRYSSAARTAVAIGEYSANRWQQRQRRIRW